MPKKVWSEADEAVRAQCLGILEMLSREDRLSLQSLIAEGAAEFYANRTREIARTLFDIDVDGQIFYGCLLHLNRADNRFSESLKAKEIRSHIVSPMAQPTERKSKLQRLVAVEYCDDKGKEHEELVGEVVKSLAGLAVGQTAVLVFQDEESRLAIAEDFAHVADLLKWRTRLKHHRRYFLVAQKLKLKVTRSA